jgi:hypothetical protein
VVSNRDVVRRTLVNHREAAPGRCIGTTLRKDEAKREERAGEFTVDKRQERNKKAAQRHEYIALVQCTTL